MILYILYFMCILNITLSKSFNDTDTEVYEDIVPRVVNGFPASLGDVPYQVAFKTSINGRSKNRFKLKRYVTFCGGVIVAPAKLLSAAHCFAKKPTIMDKICGSSGHINKRLLSHAWAVAGQLSNQVAYQSYNPNRPGQWKRLRAVRYPPSYNFPKLDIAIVFLLSPFAFNSHVNSIPYASKFIDYNGQCLVSGFGRISNRMTSDKLLLAHLTLIPAKMCNAMHRKNMTKFICTSSQYTDVGKGDSGGPLVCANTGDPNDTGRGVLVGIVSGHAYSIGSFFTRVSSFYKYIERNKSYTKSLHYLLLMLVLIPIHWRFSLFSCDFIIQYTN